MLTDVRFLQQKYTLAKFQTSIHVVSFYTLTTLKRTYWEQIMVSAILPLACQQVLTIFLQHPKQHFLALEWLLFQNGGLVEAWNKRVVSVYISVVLYYIVWYSMVLGVVVWCGIVWYGMVCYGVVWYDMVWYGVVLYTMLWYSILWYDMICHGMICHGMVCCGMVYGVIQYGMKKMWYSIAWLVCDIKCAVWYCIHMLYVMTGTGIVVCYGMA